jgi:hypothetical protein
MFVYTVIPAAQDSLSSVSPMFATNGTANTISTHWMWTTGSTIATTRLASIQGLYYVGRGAGLVAISGIMLRVMKTATIGTAGTAATPHPRDPAAQAAITTFTTAPTLGTGAVTSLLVVGCGAAGPGGWVSPNPDSNLLFAAGGTATHGVGYLVSGSGTASLNFDLTIEYSE